MSREQTLAKYRHVLMGMMLDGASRRELTERAIWYDLIRHKVDSILSQIHFDITKEELGAAPSGAPKDAKPESK